MLFFLVLQLQVSAGYTPLQAGLATVLLTVVMLLLSSRAGALAGRIGPRLRCRPDRSSARRGAPAARVGEGTSYFTGVLPGLLVFSLGLAALVAPLTTSVLAAAPDRFAGTASGITTRWPGPGRCWRSRRCRPRSASPARTTSAEVFTAGYTAALLVCRSARGGGVVSLAGCEACRGPRTSPRAGAACARARDAARSRSISA